MPVETPDCALPPIDGESRRVGWYSLPIVLLCLVYLVLQVLYITHTEFNPDEMQGAFAVHRLQTELPYRDFRPYKTVLGYYLQYPVMRLCDDPWTCLILIRGELALISTAVLLSASMFLARRFRADAVCLGLLFLVTMSTFLERSSEIRSDMLSAWCGLAALLLLLDRRFIAAGIACGLSFFVSQKGVYYIIASDLALAAWLLSQRDRSTLRNCVAFNLSMLGVLVAYLGFWSVLSSPSDVVNAIFFSHHDIAFGKLYAIHGYWFQTLRRNPFFYLIGFVGLCELLAALIVRSADYRHRVLGPYALALLALCIWHKQPWPYFFVMLIPTVFVVHVVFFQARLDDMVRRRSGLLRGTAIACTVIAALIPLTRLGTTLRRENRFQQQMFNLIDACLDGGNAYIDGMDLCYHRRQTTLPFRWLDRARLADLYALSPDEMRALLEQFDEAPVKVIVNNWRIQRVPEPIKGHLFMRYHRLWGNLYVYSPVLAPDSWRVEIKFGGTYLVEGTGAEALRIDGRDYVGGNEISLPAGPLQYDCRKPFRLQLRPEGWEKQVDSLDAEERPGFMEFDYGC